MNLQPSQYAALKAYIDSQPQWASLPNTSDNALLISQGLNLIASPAFYVYKAFAASSDAGYSSECSTYGLGNVISYVALAALTAANLQSWQSFYQLNPQFYDPSRVDIQNFMANIWSGALGGAGQATRDGLLAYGYRSARVIEKVFATGTGTTASPAKLVFVGDIQYPDVQAARGA